MFEVGKSYILHTVHGAGESIGTQSAVWEIVEIEGNLLHVRGPDMSNSEFAPRPAPGSEKASPKARDEMVLNLSSILFHSAEPLDGGAMVSAKKGMNWGAITG